MAEGGSRRLTHSDRMYQITVNDWESHTLLLFEVKLLILDKIIEVRPSIKSAGGYASENCLINGRASLTRYSLTSSLQNASNKMEFTTEETKDLQASCQF